jgi:hypothetical protein
MIKKKLLKNVSPEVEKALSVLNHSVGSMIGLQILIADPSEDLLEAYSKQGSKLSEVNEAREKVGLHKISFKMNQGFIPDSWIEPIKSKKAAVFVFLNGFNRMKSNRTIESSINYVSEILPEIAFDINSSVKNDFFLCYLKEQVIDSEDPSEEVLDLQGPEPKKKRKTTRNSKKDESI